MHLKFLRCQQMFCCFSVKSKPTSSLLFCEVVLIIALCAVLVSNHRNRIGDSTSISKITTWIDSAYRLDCQYFFNAQIQG